MSNTNKLMGEMIIEVIDHIRNMQYEEGIPNKTIINDNEFIININFGPRLDDLVMSIHTYHANMDDFVAEYVMFHSQPIYYHPEKATPETALFSITGAPKGEIFTCSTTFEAESLDEAIDESFSYVMNNIGDMLNSYYNPISYKL